MDQGDGDEDACHLREEHRQQRREEGHNQHHVSAGKQLIGPHRHSHRSRSQAAPPPARTTPLPIRTHGRLQSRLLQPAAHGNDTADVVPVASAMAASSSSNRHSLLLLCMRRPQTVAQSHIDTNLGTWMRGVRADDGTQRLRTRDSCRCPRGCLRKKSRCACPSAWRARVCIGVEARTHRSLWRMYSARPLSVNIHCTGTRLDAAESRRTRTVRALPHLIADAYRQRSQGQAPLQLRPDVRGIFLVRRGHHILARGTNARE